jgi:hypothetical protein
MDDLKMNHLNAPWMQKIPSEARQLIDAYCTDHTLPLQKLTDEVKRDVWLAGLILGEKDLMMQLYDYEDVSKKEFTPTLNKIKDWLDLKRDRDELMKAFSLLTRISQVTGDMLGYYVSSTDYSIAYRIVGPDDIPLQRILVEWGSRVHDPDDVLYVRHNEEKYQREPPSREESIELFIRVLINAFGNIEKLNILATSCGLVLRNNIILDEISLKPYVWKGKVSEKAEGLFESYLLSAQLPKKDEHRTELWQLAWATGDIYLLKHLYSYDEMDQPEFGQIMATVLSWINIEEQKDYALMLLMALAVGHRSILRVNQHNTEIGQSFMDFLVLHDNVLGECFDVLWKKIASLHEIVIIRANEARVVIEDKGFASPSNILNYFDEKKVLRPNELFELIRSIELMEGVELLLPQLKALTSCPEGIITKIREQIVQPLSKRDLEGIKAIAYFGSRFHCDAINRLLSYPRTTLESMVVWIDKLGLDRLKSYFCTFRNSVSSGDLTPQNIESARWLVHWLKPQILSQLSNQSWLELTKGLKAASLRLGSKDNDKSEVLSLPLTVYPDIRFLGFSIDNCSKQMIQIDRQRYPALEEVEFYNGDISIEGRLPANVKNLTILNYPRMEGMTQPPTIALDHQEHIQMLNLMGNSCYPINGGSEEPDLSQPIFQMIAKMPSLTKLCIALCKWVNLEHMPELAKSLTLKEIHIRYYDIEKGLYLTEEEIIKKFQPIVGDAIKLSAFTESPFSRIFRFIDSED